MPNELAKAYDPSAIEERWAEFWVRSRLFHVATPPESGAGGSFTMLLPPPNVTGRLHMGHMLNQTEMDILARWHRMRGDRTLWVPGTDHAGIATQMMVERQLAAENTTRQQVGREAFLERVWQWRNEYGGAILDQMKRLGASVDWSREYFTMDEGLSAAVREAFVRLYEQGLIYRGAYIVNWCPRCQTAISDLEVVHEEQAGKLWLIRYPELAGGDGVVIATTRPETMLGDVAVAVHPGDERYTHLEGKRLRLPLLDREIPMVTDEWVSREFGTGAVKITPAHDPNDFALGQRHGLPSINVMDESARINEAGGPYAGLDRYEARKRILADLEAQGLLVGTREHSSAIGRCDRCRTVVEPRLSLQWFVKIQPLAERAIAAVEQGHIRFTPENYAKTYFEWMRNIHDWCISRQLWWGHRIPAWHCSACGGTTVARETPDRCAHCASGALTQETDVLDTWFSSGLLPMSVFGWPRQTPDLADFYPTSLLVTGFDILFFWVARMIMLGCWFMQEVPLPDGSARPLGETVPFREVYIHALVRDAERQKMSKTKGNVIDPVEIVRKYGTDAVRFTLASMASPGTDIAFSEPRTEGYRAFANKIWNAARFVFLQMENARRAGFEAGARAPRLQGERPLESRWIESRARAAIAGVNAALGAYRFDEAAHAIYQFFWGDFCDWYLEVAKLRLRFDDAAAADLARMTMRDLTDVFETALLLLSPFMPFLTEELWHGYTEGEDRSRSIALVPFPKEDRYADDAAAESDFGKLQEFIVQARALRKEKGVEEKALVEAHVRTTGEVRALLEGEWEIVQRLGRLGTIRFVEHFDEGVSVRHTPDFDLAVIYEKPVDRAAERARLTKELARLESEMAGSQRQLGNPAFLAKAPAAVVEGLRKRAEEVAILLPKTRAALAALERDEPSASA